MLPGHNNVHRLDVQQNECQRSYNIHEDMFNIKKNMKNIICFNSKTFYFVILQISTTCF